MFLRKYKNKKLLLKDQNSLLPTRFPIQLSQNEKVFLLKELSNSENYLEFGSGGSTFLSLLYSNAKIYSVESDNNWIEYLRKWKIVRENENRRLFFNYVDIGKTGEWGIPLEKDKEYLYENYSKMIFAQKKDFDLVFVDGRFRIACILQTLLNCMPYTKILMHDFNDRPYYHSILEFLEIIDTADTMALFKIKNLDKEKISALFDKEKNNYE